MSLDRELEQKIGKAKPNGQIQESIRCHTDLVKSQAKVLHELGYISSSEYKILVYVCEKHDYGKINEAMQNRMKSPWKKFDEDIEMQHNVLSALFVNSDDFDKESEYYMALYAVLYHHPNRINRYTLASVLKSNHPLIDDFIHKYVSYGAKRPKIRCLKKIDELTNRNDNKTISQEDRELYNGLIKMKGLLHKCDYSASAHVQCEYANNFLLNDLSLLLKKWQKESSSEEVDWNDLQRYALLNTENNIIVTAPTGSGKTEAGLLWAGNNKCFFVLPLKTAINAMYDRISTEIITDVTYLNEKIALLHSDTQSYYFSNSDIDLELGEEELLEYTQRSKQMSLPITISTMDQIFDFGLKYYGYEHKLVTLSYSKIIIDEIQMYSPDLLAYMIYGIKKIVELGGKVAILTATLPPFAKVHLQNAIGKDVKFADFSCLGKVRHNVKVMKKQLNSKDIFDKWIEFKNKESRKFLVICNSVKTSQRIYRELCQLMKDEDVSINLLHSKFTKTDRYNKEKRILETGKTNNPDGTRNNRHEIWVTTSVVEASLNIDFDYLFTELLELFSLLQRLGRENRIGLKSIDEYNCFVYTELQDQPLKGYNDTSGNAYKFVDNTIYDLSKEAILTVDGILSEEQKTKLINEYLSYDKLNNTKYSTDYNNMYKMLEGFYPNENSRIPIREIDNIDIIPLSVYNAYENIIDRAELVLKQKDSTAIERINASETIKQYTVSVHYSSVYENNKGRIVPKSNIEKSISLSKNYEVRIINFEYDSEYGLGSIIRNGD